MNIIFKFMKSRINQWRLRVCKRHGHNINIGKNCVLRGNIELGSHISIGHGALFVSTCASLKIHDYVVIAPNVTIYTGDHAIDFLGKHIIDVSEQDKNKTDPQKYDKDVTIESGCWIGTRAVILKGVTIGRGSVIGAGAVVTRDVPPYSIYVGVPSSKLIPRFNNIQIAEHERLLSENGLSPDSF